MRKVPAELYTVTADDGTPLLIYGVDEANTVMIWPTPYIKLHRVAFGRFCRKHVHELRGKRIVLQHVLSTETCRWAEWLGVTLEPGVARV